MKTLPKEKRYETLSYLPPLTDQQIAKQIQYMIDQGYIPAVEFEKDPKPADYHWRCGNCLYSLFLVPKKFLMKFASAALNILIATSALSLLTTSNNVKP